jgi:hypothetical protein
MRPFFHHKKIIMSKKIAAAAMILVFAGLICTTGCYKVTTLVVDNTQAITRPVSFSKDLVPIFDKSCAISGCHKSGGTSPDLSAANAYNSIINGSLVNLGTPASSELYLWLTGKRAVAMPAGAANNPSSINQLVLAWVTQGAKNN